MEGAGGGIQGTLIQNAIPGHIEDLKLMESLPKSVLKPSCERQSPHTRGIGAPLSPKAGGTQGRTGTSRPRSAVPRSPRCPHTA